MASNSPDPHSSEPTHDGPMTTLDSDRPVTSRTSVGPLRPSPPRRPSFAARWRGYDRVQVDTYVEHQHRLAAALRDRAQRAEARLTGDATEPSGGAPAPRPQAAPRPQTSHDTSRRTVARTVRTLSGSRHPRGWHLEPPVIAGAGAGSEMLRLAHDDDGTAARTQQDVIDRTEPQTHGATQREAAAAPRASGRIAVGLAVTVLAAVGAVVWFGFRRPSASARPGSVHAGVIQPHAGHATHGTAPPPDLVLDAMPHARCWVRVRSGGPTGPIVFQATLIHGSGWATSPTGSLWVEVGWASHLHATLAGRTLRLTGGPTTVIIRGSSVTQT